MCMATNQEDTMSDAYLFDLLVPMLESGKGSIASTTALRRVSGISENHAMRILAAYDRS